MVGTLLVLTLLVGACSGGDDDASAPSATTVDAADDAPQDEHREIDAVSELLQDDGTLSTEDALTLFSSSVSPVTGVEVDPALEGLELDRSFVVRSVVDRWDQLSDAQQSELEPLIFGPEGMALTGEVVGPETVEPEPEPGDRTSSSVPNLRAPTVRPASFGGVDDLDRTGLVRSAVSEISSRLGRGIDLPVSVVDITRAEATEIFRGSSEKAMATGIPGAGGVFERCIIRFNPNAGTALDGATALADLRGVVAHEVFHCFQYDMLDTMAAVTALPEWVKEGSAAWVGETVSGGTAVSDSWWFHWLTNPRRGLTERTYDAIGMYALVDAVGGDVWGRLHAVVTGSDRLAELLGADTEAVLGRWGASVAREPGWGSDWDSTGPGITSARVEPEPFVVQAMDAGFRTERGVVAAGGAARQYWFPADGEILSIVVSGLSARLHLAGGTDLLLPADRQVDFCLRAGGCECPDGGEPLGELLEAEEGDATLGVAALAAGGSVSIGLQSVEAFCTESETPTTTATTEPPAGDGACLIGSWSSGPWIVPAGEPSGGSGISLTLEAGGTGQVSFDGMAPVTLRPDAGPEAPPVETTIRYGGSGPVTWTATAGEVAIQYADTRAFTYSMIATFNGATVVDQSGTFADIEGSVPFTGATPYRCGEAGWALTMPVPGGTGALELPFS